MTVIKKRIFLFLFVWAGGCVAQETIRITNGEWAPYHSEYIPHYGLSSHIVSEAFKLVGINVEWGFFPWKRAYHITKDGREWDASALWWKSKKLEEDFLISDEVIRSSLVFFFRKKDAFEWHSWEDIKGKIIGVTEGYDYGDEFKKAVSIHHIKLDFAPSDKLSYLKLLSNRVDLFPNDRLVGMTQIHNHLNDQQADLLDYAPQAFAEISLHLIVSKNIPNGQHFIEKFNAGLRLLKESGKLAQMFEELEKGKYIKQATTWQETTKLSLSE